MTFNFLNQGQNTDITKVTPIDTFIDPVSKIRVSNPGNLIDTDFEYGLQPTKWETVEIINNTPAFFSKSGDTTISDITGISTNAGTREVTVTTAFPHLLDVGIPIRVSGTKELTADGSYIINATPSPTTFTYLSRANQAETISIFDLYTSIITGEFFQGSQISISDSEGVVTDGQGPNSTLTVKTSNKHGFGNKTPFYFLNLNSTVSQEFEAQNSTTLSFDPTNSATAQTFDGSNTLLQTPIDLSNSATTSIYQNSITSTDATNATVTINIASGDEGNWDDINYGDPLYHDVNVGSGYFQSNPRGVVFIKNVDGIDTENNTATFQVSELPDGDVLPILANMTGYFQIANEAKTFAGNNVDENTQIEIQVEVGQEFLFDGGNQGYDGEPENPPSNVGTVVGYTGTTISLFTAEGNLDYYEGAMLQYNSDDTDANELSSSSTYFVTSFAAGQSSGLFNMTIAELPGGDDISVSGGSGTQTFSKIGVSIDKDIVHVRDSNFEKNDMLEYLYPENGNFGADIEQKFYFVINAYDEHNYQLSSNAGFIPIVATGGDVVTEIFSAARTWKLHQFNSTGTSSFVVEDIGGEDAGKVDVLVVAGGGGGGSHPTWASGGGGAGGVVFERDIAVSNQSYSITVGSGASAVTTSSDVRGNNGANSTAFGLVALGGGGGGGNGPAASTGGSGGGGHESDGTGANATQPTSASGGFGNRGGNGSENGNYGGGGGGAGEQGGTDGTGTAGDGIDMSLYFGTNVGENGFFGGGGSGGRLGGARAGGVGGGGRGGFDGQPGLSGAPNTGGGGGGGRGAGGSGTVIIRYPITAIDPNFISASGGKESTIVINNEIYAVHEFINIGNSTFTVNSLGINEENNVVDALIVAGGGAAQSGTDFGGGGAGGLIYSQGISINEQSYTVTVGAGGSTGNNGNNSSAFGLVALGGGSGGDNGTQPSANGAAGGSGGGGGYRSLGGSGLQPGSSSGGFGNRGGDGNRASGITNNTAEGGGGGGAGGPGETAPQNNRPGRGGPGLDYSNVFSSAFGDSGFFASGGSGGGETAGNLPAPRAGGGANWNTNSIPNTGGGGAATNDNNVIASVRNGASGVVLIRYKIGVVN